MTEDHPLAIENLLEKQKEEEVSEPEFKPNRAMRRQHLSRHHPIFTQKTISAELDMIGPKGSLMERRKKERRLKERVRRATQRANRN